MTAGINTEPVKNQITEILSDYDITRATKEIALLADDQNMMLLKKFLMAKRVEGRTRETLKTYFTYLNAMLLEIKKPAAEITVDDLRMYLAIKETRDNNSKSNLCNIQRVASTFFEFLVREGYINLNPVKRLGQVKTPKEHKKAFSDIEIEKLRESCRTAREKAIVEIFLCTGCRVSELTRMRINEIEGDTIIVHGKGNKDRIVYFNAKAQMAITRYLNERSDSNPYLFPKVKPSARITGRSPSWYTNADYINENGHCSKSTIETIVKKLGKRSGIAEVYPHKFRRTCATMALKRGMEIVYVSKMLGHESVETTQRYLDLNEEQLAHEHRKCMV